MNFRKVFWFIVLVAAASSIIGGGIFLRNMRQFQEPIELKDVPVWELVVQQVGIWELHAKDEPKRKTMAYFEGNPNGKRCDSIILMGGLEEGQNLAYGALHIPDRANIVVLSHPINQFFKASPWKTWGVLDWLRIPQVLKNEMKHTLGALIAVQSHLLDQSRLPTPFSNKVLLGGGSFGGSFPIIVTSYAPEKVAGMMMIYGFTNFELVIQRELTRQALIHNKLMPGSPGDGSFTFKAKVMLIKILGRVLGVVFGNVFKYGEPEPYLQKIHNVPTYFINGKNDHLVPLEAFTPMWEATHEPKTQVWVAGDHIHPGNRNEVRVLVDYLVQWSSANNLWQCQALDKPTAN